MKVQLESNKCKVTKEAGDKRYSQGYALPESAFLYHVMQQLRKQGYNVIKKRMYKDGHLVDDTQQYIRSRKAGADMLMIYNSSYAIYDAGLEFNKLSAGDSIYLTVA